MPMKSKLTRYIARLERKLKTAMQFHAEFSKHIERLDKMLKMAKQMKERQGKT